MPQALNESLARITRGTVAVMVGSVSSLVLGFISRVLVARHGSAADFGVFSLALVLLNFCVILAGLGMRSGTSRSIAYAWGRNETAKTGDIISGSIWMVLAASLSVGLALFFGARTIAETVLGEPGLTSALRILSPGIPLFALLYHFVAIMLGFSLVRARVYFQDITRNVLLCLLLGGIIILDLSFQWTFYAVLTSLAVPCLLAVGYVVRRSPSPIALTVKPSTLPAARELAVFSLPLLGVAALGLAMAWTDTIMLGYFKVAEDVGMYNSAHWIALLLASPLNVLSTIYLPVTTGMYARGLMDEVRRDFSVLTKWLCSATFPLFLAMAFFPRETLTLLFGPAYSGAGDALRLLSVGFMLANFAGPSGVAFIATGRSPFLMYVSLTTLAANVALNIALIPPLGILGAAIATVVARSVTHVIRGWRLYALQKVQPLSWNLVKPVLVTTGLVFIVYLTSGDIIAGRSWTAPLFIVVAYAIYAMALVTTRSVEKEDLALVRAVARRTGLDRGPTGRILQRFL